MSTESIPAAHPELVGSIDWTWRKDDWRYVLWGSDACGQVWQSDETEWGWHAGGGFGFCETFAEAREQAEQAVADWLRAGGK